MEGQNIFSMRGVGQSVVIAARRSSSEVVFFASTALKTVLLKTVMTTIPVTPGFT